LFLVFGIPFLEPVSLWVHEPLPFPPAAQAISLTVLLVAAPVPFLYPLLNLLLVWWSGLPFVELQMMKQLVLPECWGERKPGCGAMAELS